MIFKIDNFVIQSVNKESIVKIIACGRKEYNDIYETDLNQTELKELIEFLQKQVVNESSINSND